MDKAGPSGTSGSVAVRRLFDDSPCKGSFFSPSKSIGKKPRRPASATKTEYQCRKEKRSRTTTKHGTYAI